MKWIGKLLPVFMASIVFLAPAGASAYWITPQYSAPVRTLATSPTAPKADNVDATTASVEKTLLQLANQERSRYGLAPLQADTTLANLARLKSRDMVAKHYFSHNSPTYGSPAQMLAKYGISYMQFAENIAQGSSATQIHQMWMASPGHRANILNPQLTKLGVGVAQDGMGYTATQLFITAR
jgi:uncharacterized YkwD family protein